MEVDVPLVRDYTSYRAFLKDWFTAKKKARAGFSYRRFSSVLGLKSPNFMQLVLKGERNLSEALAEKVVSRIHLQGAQRSYFLALVGFEQAKDEEERTKFEKALLAARRKMVTSHITKTRTQILSTWYHMLVRELVFLPNFEPTGAFIAKALNGLISESEAEASFQSLVESGFVKKDEKGRWVPVDLALDTGDYLFQREVMREHHSRTLKTWARNLDELSPREQELGLLHIPIASEKIPELRERIRRFQDEIIGWLCEEKNPDRVVQLGTYLIPFSPVSDEPPGK